MSNRVELEDILDDAARYVRGEMDDEERSFFEELVDRHPHLREDLRLMQLVHEGLKSMEARPAAKAAPVWSKPWVIAVLALLGAGLIGAIAWGIFFRQGKQTDRDSNSAVQVEGERRADEYIQFRQLGDENAALDAEIGYAVQWTPDGQLAFAGALAGGDGQAPEHPLSNALFGTYDGDAGAFTMLKTFGEKGQDDRALGIAADSRGDLLVCGRIGDQALVGNRRIRTEGTDDAGKHDFFIAKFSPAGTLRWIRHQGGTRDKDRQTGRNQAIAVAAGPGDEVVVAGNYIGSPTVEGKKLPSGGPNEELFLAQYAPSGELQWVLTATCNYMITPKDVGADAQGNVYVCGAFGHHNLGGFAVFEQDTLYSYGGKDLFLAKYSPEGKLLWVRQAGSALRENGYDMANHLAIGPDGRVTITGIFQGEARFGSQTLVSSGGMDLFAAQYLPNGDLAWARQAGGKEGSGPHLEQGFAVATDRWGAAYVTGAFAGEARFGSEVLRTTGAYNFFLAKYSPQGRLEWAISFLPGADFLRAEGRGIDIHSNGSIAVTGAFAGSIQIGDTVLKSKGKEDFFLLLFNENGELISARALRG